MNDLIFNIKQVGKTNSWVIDNRILVSYSTIVGFKSCLLDSWVYTDKKYSKTTTSHINKHLKSTQGVKINHQEFIYWGQLNVHVTNISSSCNHIYT